MGAIDFVSVIICLLAVIGVYFLLCKLLGGIIGHRFTVGIRVDGDEDEYDILCAWHSAQMMTSSQRDAEAIPVVLFDGNVNTRTLHLLRDEGIPVYQKMEN